VTSHDHTPRVWGPMNVLWSLPQDVKTFSKCMQRCPYIVKHTDATWGISGDVYHISIMLFYRYTKHVCISHTARTNYGDECDLPPIIRMSYIFGEAFLLVRNV
jgi:hypothetical protein